MPSESSKFEILKEQRRKDYETWKPIYCPAVGEYVDFNSKGFSHLNFKIDNTPRTLKEAAYKLRLLPFVRPVIHKALKTSEYRKATLPSGRSKKIRKEKEYWAIVAVVGENKSRIKVILRRVGAGRIHFWSVMELA